MIIDGRALAQTILAATKAEVAGLDFTPKLTVFTCSPNFETRKYLALKQRKALEIGVTLELIEFKTEVTTSEIIASLNQAHQKSDGIIVQLPFPPSININEVIMALLPTHDVDALTYDGMNQAILPPVVGAIAEIAKQHQVEFKNKNVVIIGRGRLVGAPTLIYVENMGADSIIVLDRDSENIETALLQADIIISGTGTPGLITAEKVKAGVVVFDAGTSESAGVLVGDADPSVATKAQLFTPVPGGIGPMTVAILFRNLVTLAKQHRKSEPDVI